MDWRRRRSNRNHGCLWRNGRAMSEHKKGHPIVSIVMILAVGTVFVMIQKRLYSPDFGKTMRMRIILGAKHFAQNQADHNYQVASEWQNLALKAGTQYNRARM